MPKPADHDFTQKELREQIAQAGRSLFDRRFTHGSTGNLSLRVSDGVLITPTNSCLGNLDADRIAKVDFQGNHVGGAKPSKEAFLHLAMYRSRPGETSVVHLHSTYSVAVSCLDRLDPENVLPPITAYQMMRVGKCPLVPYFAPGDRALADAVGERAKTSRAMLLSNHGPVISAGSLAGAVAGAEELEETAKLFLLLQGQKTRFLNEDDLGDLEKMG